MASDFNTISKEFLSQFVNGPNFTLDLLNTTARPQFNEGSIGKIIETISLSITVNPFASVSMKFQETADATFGILMSPSLNFIDEGLWAGALVDVEFDNQTVTGLQIGIISGPNYLNLQIEKAALIAAGMFDGETRTDIVIKLTSAPKVLNYKYGLNPLDLNTPNYQSPFDSNEQSYYVFDIPNSPSTVPMIWSGSQIGVDLGSVIITFDGTVGTYNHEYTLQHVFKVPYYFEGEQDNLKNQIVPFRHAGTKSLKYGNGFFFGGTTSNYSAIFEDVGGTNPGAGNIGYPGESFNGGINNYEIEDLVITNSSATGKLEATETNTVTFGLRKNNAIWAVGQKVILTHSKLAISLEYQNQTTPYNTIWIFENLGQDEGIAPVSGTVITNFEFNIDGGDPNLMNVTADIVYTSPQQVLISSQADYWLEVTVGDETLTAELMDRVNLTVDQNKYSKNLDVPLLITAPTMKFFPSWSGYAGAKFFKDFTGGDGDLWGGEYAWTQSTVLGAKINKAVFKVIAEDGSGNKFTLLSKNFNLGALDVFDDGTYEYQIINTNFLDVFNLPTSEPLNHIIASILIPIGLPSTTQTALFRIAFQTPWQEWIENLTVDNVFYDNTLPNNNKNQKTSNYSGVSGYEIYGILTLNVENNVNPEQATVYNLYSDASTILKFDDVGWVGFTSTFRYIDENGDPTLNLLKSQNVRIEIDFDHALGIIILADLKGFIWIEPENSTAQPWFLSTEKDYTDGLNPLQPTDTLVTGNTQFVEMVSIAGKVTLICQTNRDNLTSGVIYKVRGRLWSAK